jgi:hypothetical protein
LIVIDIPEEGVEMCHDHVLVHERAH